MCSQDDDPSQHMAPTPEAIEALATALGEVDLTPKGHPSNPLWAAAILAALPPGTVLTTVDDVARRLCDWPWPAPPCGDPAHTAEAKRLLGVTE